MGKQKNNETKILEKLGQFHNVKIKCFTILFVLIAFSWVILSHNSLKNLCPKPNPLELIGGFFVIVLPMLLFIFIAVKISKMKISKLK